MFREKFSKRLRELRLSRGLSQEQLAKIVHTSTNAIGMYETGKRIPREEILEGLYDYFDVSLDYLFGFSDDPDPYKRKEIDVFEIRKGVEKEILEKNGEQVLFKNGDFALKVTDTIADSLSPFYFINDVLIFEQKAYQKNAISIIFHDARFHIGKLMKKGSYFYVEFLNPVVQGLKIPVDNLELTGVLIGMIRLMKNRNGN